VEGRKGEFIHCKISEYKNKVSGKHPGTLDLFSTRKEMTISKFTHLPQMNPFLGEN
jgi:hypothetical protein